MTDSEEQKLEQLVRTAGRRPQIPTDVRDRLEASFRDELLQAGKLRLNRRLRAGIGIAACLVLGMFMVNLQQPARVYDIALVERYQGETTWHNDGLTGPLRTGATIKTNDRIITADGSLAIKPLNSHLDIRLAAMTEVITIDAKTLRLVKGSVYVDAAPGGSPQPYTILVNDYSIEHVGTQYLVSVEPSGISVAVREGEVRIDTDDGLITSHAGPNAGEIIHFGAGNVMSREQMAPFDSRWQWAAELAPSLDTNGMRLQEFLGWVERQSGFRVAYASDEVERSISSSEHTISGSIETKDVMGALDIAAPLEGYITSRANGVIIIDRR